MSTPMFDSYYDGYRIYVGGLNPDTTRDVVYKEFERFGPIADCWVAKNPPGFSFIVFKHSSDSEYAVSKMNNKRIWGDRLKVEHAKFPSNPRGPGGKATGGKDRSRSPRGVPAFERYDRRRSRSYRRRSRSYNRSGGDYHRSRNNGYAGPPRRRQSRSPSLRQRYGDVGARGIGSRYDRNGGDYNKDRRGRRSISRNHYNNGSRGGDYGNRSYNSRRRNSRSRSRRNDRNRNEKRFGRSRTRSRSINKKNKSRSRNKFERNKNRDVSRKRDSSKKKENLSRSRSVSKGRGFTKSQSLSPAIKNESQSSEEGKVSNRSPERTVKREKGNDSSKSSSSSSSN